MRKDDKQVGCTLRNKNLAFWLNRRAGTPTKPEDYDGIRLYWAPSDIYRGTAEVMESLSPFLQDSFIPYNMPVYPGAYPDCHHGTTGSDSQRVGYAVSR